MFRKSFLAFPQIFWGYFGEHLVLALSLLLKKYQSHFTISLTEFAHTLQRVSLANTDHDVQDLALTIHPTTGRNMNQTDPAPQTPSSNWRLQWSMFNYGATIQFKEWIAPATLETFRGRDVLECGCGGRDHTFMVADLARTLTAVDLNTAELARSRNKQYTNIEFVEADLATMNLGRCFDVAFCVGVIHHTDNPTRTFENIYRHLKPGGALIIYGYAAEGNWPMRLIVEPTRRILIRHLPRWLVLIISIMLTAALYPIVHTLYRLPIANKLPYYQFFFSFRKFEWRRNLLDTYDKLSAPQQQFLTRQVCDSWMTSERFEAPSISIRHHLGVCWSLVGIKSAAH